MTCDAVTGEPAVQVGRVPGWCGFDDLVTVGDDSGPYLLGQAASSGACGGLVEINWTIGGEI
jgi:hypothetical protein